MTKLLYPELSYKIRGCFLKIRREYGPGQKEKIYHNLLKEILTDEGLKFESEPRIEIKSKSSGKVVGIYQPDFLIEDKVIVEVKSTKFPTKTAEEQLLYYLRNSPYALGFLVNFGTEKFYLKRIIFTNDRKKLNVNL